MSSSSQSKEQHCDTNSTTMGDVKGPAWFCKITAKI